MFKIPKNGMYLTSIDNEEYTNLFWSRYIASNNLLCSSCHVTSLIPNITFVVTESCNLNCSYCYEKHKTSRQMTKEIAKQAVDVLFSGKIKNYFSDPKGYCIEFFGGVPLLQIDLIEYIINYYNQKCFELNKELLQNSMFNMTTNGVLYHTDKVQKFIARHNKKLSMGITIDGNKQLHDSCRKFSNGLGSYDIVSKAVKDWMGKTLTANTTKVTIAHDNIPYIFESFIHLWQDLDIQFINSNCVFESGWHEGDDQLLYDQLIKVADYLIDNDLYDKYYTSFFDENIGHEELELDENGCGGNGRMLAIAPDGKLYPCVRFMDYSLNNREGKCIGNINDGININDPWLVELQKVTLRTQSDEECLNCKIASGCSICTGYNYDEFGTPNKRAKYICKMHQARVCATAYYYNKLYTKLGLNKHFQLNIEDRFKR